MGHSNPIHNSDGLQPEEPSGPAGHAIVGSWKKVEPAEGAHQYPDDLEFKPRGIYLGRNVEGGFTLWDAGGYQVVSAGRLRLSIANDAEVVYRFSISENTLTIWTEDGIFRYRRVE